MLMMFLKWLKSLLAAMAAMFSNLLSAILGIIIAMAKAVVGFFIGLGAGIVSVVGGAIGTGVAAMGSFVVTIFLVIGGSVATVAAVQTSDLARHEPAVMADCSADFAQTVSMTDGTIDAGAETEANAQLIYSVLAGWGMPDENIAGIIGNWDAESGIDPTSVEGIFDERFHIGPSKQQAIDEDFGGFGYGDYSVEYRGIGLAQWTNGRNPNLRKYAERAGLEWYQIEAQLGFMISADEGSDAEIVKGMIRESLDSPGAAALYFHDEWERSADTSMMKQRRLDSASSWYAKMGGWEADHDLANSILEQSGTALEGADKAAVRTAMNECVSQGLNIDNTELATAWTSYAWPYKEDSRFNDGTYLYVWLHEEIFPGDPYFASCDRGVATGVRWSGTDDTYPPGAVQQQINYLQTSDKWEQVTEWNGDESVLRPGDIFIRKDSEVSHTIAYTGPDAPMQIWGAGKYEPGQTSCTPR